MNTNLLHEVKTASHEAIGPPRPQIRRILTTTDFSDVASLGTDYAIRLAHKLGASIHVMHVIEPLPAVEGMEAFPLLHAPYEIARQARARLKKIAVAQVANRLRFSTSVCVG